MVLCGIICATRFKYFKEGILFPTECRRCGEVDSFVHLLRCTGMGPVPEPGVDSEPTVLYLAELARRACRIGPGLPLPKRGILAEDLSLRMETSAEEEEPASAEAGIPEQSEWLGEQPQMHGSPFEEECNREGEDAGETKEEVRKT